MWGSRSSRRRLAEAHDQRPKRSSLTGTAGVTTRDAKEVVVATALASRRPRLRYLLGPTDPGSHLLRGKVLIGCLHKGGMAAWGSVLDLALGQDDASVSHGISFTIEVRGLPRVKRVRFQVGMLRPGKSFEQVPFYCTKVIRPGCSVGGNDMSL